MTRVDAPKIPRERIAAHLADCTCQLDAGGAAADDDERQVSTPLVRIAFFFRRLEGFQDSPPDLGRLRQRLQPGRVLLPLLVTEVRVLSTAGEQDIVVREVAGVGDDLARVDVEALCFGFHDPDVRLSGKYASNRHRDVGGTQSRHRHLIKKRLKEVMILAIDDRHGDIAQATQPLCGVQSCESRTDDDDLLHVRRAAAHFTMGSTRAETSLSAAAWSTQRYSLCSGRPSSSMTGKETSIVDVFAR